MTDHDLTPEQRRAIAHATLRMPDGLKPHVYVEAGYRAALGSRQAEVERLREALEKIASCRFVVSGDVVEVARKALRETGTDD